LYERLFEWLITYINKTLARENNEQLNHSYRTIQSSLVIGVLDIYGFEIFENNRYDVISLFIAKENFVNIVSNNYVLIIVMKNYNNYLLNLSLNKNKKNMNEKISLGIMYDFILIIYIFDRTSI
jgi:hypothetical protein